MRPWDPDEGNDPGRKPQPIPQSSAWRPKYVLGQVIRLSNDREARVISVDRKNRAYEVRMSRFEILTEEYIDNYGRET